MPWWQTRLYVEGLTAEFNRTEAVSGPQGVTDRSDEDDGWVSLSEMGARIEHTTFG